MWTLQLIQIIICGFLIEVSGVLEWTVIGKVTDYGQNVTLFCKVPNCCPDDAGWDRWTPHQSTLFIDVKTGRSNKKYDGQVLRDGYTLIIQNLTKQDLNVSYSCLYGVTLGERKFLLEEDVFMHMSNTPPTEFSAGELAAVSITGVVVLLSVATFIILWRRRRISYQNDLAMVLAMEPLFAKPSAPVGPIFISNITESSADIEWQTPDHNDAPPIDQYQINYRLVNTSAWEEAGTVNGNTNRFTVKDLKEGQDYYFQVTPINSAGHGTSLESVYLTKLLRIITKPSAPVGPMLISNITESSADIEWQTPEHNDAAPIDQYQIKYRLVNTSAWEEAETVNGNTNRFTVKDLKEGQGYYFQVTPINKEGHGTSLESVDQTKPKRIIEISKKLLIGERNAYIEAINIGKEVRKYVRIQVIGKDRVGKTSLVRRLLGYEKHNGASTDGIEIDRKCKIRTSDGKWIVDKDKTQRDEIIRRIHAVISDQSSSCKQLQPEENISEADNVLTEKESNQFRDDLPEKIEPDPSKITETERQDVKPKTINHTKNIVEILDTSSNNKDEKKEDDSMKKSEEKDRKNSSKMHISSLPSNENKIIETIIKDMNAILLDAKNEKDKMASEGLVECGIWDFAGQKDYYATHQTFFTPHAIYILVVDIMDGIKAIENDHDDGKSQFETSGEYIDFWFDSIHCFCEDLSTKKLCPPVIMVCTGTDKIKEVERGKTEYEGKFLSFCGIQKKMNHSRGIHFISNADQVEEDIVGLKKHILKIAKEMAFFAEELPTNWINLENALEVLKDLKETVCSWESIVKLADRNLIDSEELILFLNYHHKIGNIIFFEDIRDYIILQPNWLVKCFRCLVCDGGKKNCHESSPNDLYKLQHEGKLSENLIDELFAKESDLKFGEHKNHILDVMEKFDIIIKPNSSNKSYYMPFMIVNTSNIDEIKTELNIPKNAHCSPWLVLEFKFLPIAYCNHILYNYIRTYAICKLESGRPALYSGKAVVYLDEALSKWLVICFSKNAISLQIWNWSDTNDDKHENILRDLCIKIEELETKLSHDLYYEIKAKCSTGEYSRRFGRISYNEITKQCKEGTYHCKEHYEFHKTDELENTWLKHGAAIREEIEKKKTSRKEKSNVKAEKIDMENTDMMDADPYKKKMPVITNSKESNCNTGQGKILTSHLNQEKYQIGSGIAVVINNTEFDANLNLPDRVGSDVDAASLFRGLQKLGFKSERLNNASKEDLKNKFDKIKDDKTRLEETECLVIALMTHGNVEEVFLTDGSIKMKTFLSYFNAENCRELHMKPKIFIIQACRGTGTGLGGGVEMEVVKDKETYMRDPNQADAGGIYHEYGQVYGEQIRIPNAADFLVVYSTSFGYKGFRSTDIGTPFVHHLSEELMNISKDDNFYQVLTRINKKVGMEYRPSHKTSEIVTQMPCFSSHLTKELYFNLEGMADGSKLDVNDKDTSTTSSTTKETERNTGQGIINKSHLDQKSYTVRTGRAVVIINTEFDPRLGLSDRSESYEDAASLFQRFCELGFESDFLPDATLNDLEEKFQEIKDDKEELQKTDCLIVAVLSHGDEDSVYMTDTPVKIKAVMDYFNAQNCPELIQQPKIFIFQCSRGPALRDSAYFKVGAENKENSIPYGLETVRIPNEADFLAVYSTSLEDTSYGNTDGPSPFLSQLMKELQNMKKEDDIYTVLTKVNNKVMRFQPDNTNSKDIRQMPYFVSHLTKDLYLA